MSKSPTWKVVTIVAGAALLAGFAVGWLVKFRAGERDLASLVLAENLATTGLCANALKLQQSQRTDTLVMLLEDQLDSAIDNANEMYDDGGRMWSAELLDSVRRAADHYATTNQVARKEKADALFARLRSGR